VGHSYGGRVITQAWCRVPHRVASLVYLDAHAPVADDPGLPPERVAAAEANGGMLPFAGYDPDPDVLGEDGVAWFLERTVDHSLAAFTDPWQAELPADLPKTFVYALGNQPSRFAHYAEVCRADPAWRYHELPGDHWLMLSHPAEVAALILDP
jgi:pimeloyl-ACP methyl ester carboxylesterase